MAGAAVLYGARVLSKRRMTTRQSVALELSTFLVVILCLSLMAAGYGGLQSHYLPGISSSSWCRRSRYPRDGSARSPCPPSIRRSSRW